MLQQPFGSNWLLAFARLLMLLEFSQAPLELSVHFQAPLFRSGLRWSKRILLHGLAALFAFHGLDYPRPIFRTSSRKATGAL
jgi:hypothetical protein